MEFTKVLVIHDGIKKNDPLIFSLEEKYGVDNVIFEKRSSKGLKYIKEHLTSKIIVLLDFDLGIGEPHAPEVLEEIRKMTSLVYVIVITAKEFSTIPHDALVNFINNEALGIIQNTESINKILELVDKAVHQLDTRVDCVLEQWIANHSKKEKEKPYLTTKSNKVYTLEDLMVEIRKETVLGQQLEKSILQLAIDLLTRQKKKLND